MVPLETTPLYSANSYPNRYWTAQRNTTEWNVFIKELTTSGNAIAELMLRALAPQLHGAHIGKYTHCTEGLAGYSPITCRFVRLALPLRGHLRPAAAISERYRTTERDGIGACLCLGAEREHQRHRGVHRRRRDRPR